MIKGKLSAIRWMLGDEGHAGHLAWIFAEVLLLGKSLVPKPIWQGLDNLRVTTRDESAR